MKNHPSLLAFVVLSALLISTKSATAALIMVPPSETVRVAWDQLLDRSNTGNDFRAGGGAISSSTYAVRERGNASQTSDQGVTYLKFDTSSLTPAFVSSSGFYSTFSIDFTARVNTVNNLGIGLDVVDTANTWSNSSGDFPLATWVAPANIGGTLTPDFLLVSNARTSPLGTVNIDVTTVVRNWVNGVSNNNGFVIFGTSDQFQGAGFENATLTAAIPEPTTALGLLGLVTSAFFRRRRRLLG